MAKVLLVSRCAWTLYNFRRGQMRVLQSAGETLLCGGAGGDGFDEKIIALGIPFVPLPVDRRSLNPAADLKLFWTLYRWYRRERPAVVHHFTIKPVIYGSLAARLAGVPRIINTVTGLGYVFTNEAVVWLRRVVEVQYRLALGCAHYTFFQNEDDRQLFVSRTHSFVTTRPVCCPVPASIQHTSRRGPPQPRPPSQVLSFSSW